ncbi:hypothetical protein KUCAC02_005640 [Chaenocephalus aceratus]|uniref:Uncharacterized protein n=1 Tax=Chaenocephalus aceratus TaxID=36190 RepID=A0ACB9WQW2_CHAAC|nr:hypothetical protein KUCAC02_005640 [Chaenocephalus aceratus]
MQNNVRGNVQGKYAQKDASKVNIYEIAQLSRASAAPAKSCTEMERTSRDILSKDLVRSILMAYFCPHNVSRGLPSEYSYRPRSHFLSIEAVCPYCHGNGIAKQLWLARVQWGGKVWREEEEKEEGAGGG